MAPLLVVSPLFPPRQGGLPDHTDHLVRRLNGEHPTAVLTSIGPVPDRPYPVHATVGPWQQETPLLAAIRTASPTGPILWQYVPHMYGRGGVNLALPRVVRRMRTEGRRQVVLAHEIAAPFSPWPHRSFYALAHRLMWRGLVASADAIGISTDAWRERLEGGRPARAAGTTFFLAPSPSNLPVVPVAEDHARRWRASQGITDHALILGFFGSPGSGKQFEWVVGAWREVRRRWPETVLVLVGGRAEPGLTSTEAAAFRSLGYLSPGPASEAIQAMDLLLLPFVDGVSERRSSFMAGLAHGRPILTTRGPGTGRALGSGDGYVGVAVREGSAGFAAAASALAGDAPRRAALAVQARGRYAANYGWDRLGATVLAHLDPPRAAGAATAGDRR